MGMIKTKREIELLKKSAAITDSCLPLIKESLKEKISERELSRRIRRRIYSQGTRLAFLTIVVCGKRSARIHTRPTSKIISGLGYVDFGASYKGYKTDATVPFIKGKVSKREKRMVQTTLEAYNLAINSIKIGLPCWKLHEKVNKFLKTKGFEMMHSLGHGLGLKIHESPRISMPRKCLKGKKKLRWEKMKKITFQEGMVFTIEPAAYVKGLGGCRIENDVLLTRSGPKILTKAKLLIIQKP